MYTNVKKWFTESRNVDRETGEELSTSRVEREKWVKVGSSKTKHYGKKFNLIIHTNEYERNRQQELKF